MEITEITVRYEETASYPTGHSNVKAGIAYTARLGETDDPARCRATLEQAAVDAVRGQIDVALESNGFPPRYAESRYRVYGLEPLKLVVLVPENVRREDLAFLLAPGEAARQHTITPLSRPSATAIARRESDRLGYGFFDCANGKLERIGRAIAQERA